MTLTHAMPVDSIGTCTTDPKWRDLSDAAMDKPGGPEAQKLKRLACRHCPVKAECGRLGVASSEWGVWGGDGPKTRALQGTSPPTKGRNLVGLHGRDPYRKAA